MTDETNNEQEDVNYDELDNETSQHVEEESQEDAGYESRDEHDEEPKHKPKGRGYLTKDQWVAEGRDPAKFKSKEEYEEFGEAYNVMKPHLDKFKQDLRQKDLIVQGIVKNVEEMKRQEAERIKSLVEAQLRQAKEVGDGDAIEKLSVQKENIQNQLKVQDNQALKDEETRVNNKFMERNGHWFNKDKFPDLFDEAIEEEKRLALQQPGLAYFQRVQRVEDYMKFQHPELSQVGRNNQDTHISSTQSGVNKTRIGASGTEENLYRGLSGRDKTDFKAIKDTVEKLTGVKYTVKQFLDQSTKYKG